MGSAASTSHKQATTTVSATHAVAKFKKKQDVAQTTEAALIVDEEKKEKELYEKHPELKDALDGFEEINDTIKTKSVDNRQILRMLSSDVYEAYADFETKEQRLLMANHMAKIGFVTTLCNYYISLLKEFNNETVSYIETGTLRGAGLLIIRGIFWNYSDASLKFAESVGLSGYLEYMMNDLDAIDKGVIAGSIDTEEEGTSLALKSAIGCVHNCAKVDTLRPIFHEMKVVDRLKPYLHTAETENKAVAIMTEAYIINDEQNDILATEDGIFEFIIDLLKQALESDDHRAEGFSAWEMAKGLGAMARNDQNKTLIAEKGAIPFLAAMLASEDEEEVEEALSTLWKLGFDQNNKRKIQEEPNCFERVKGLTKHKNSRITKAANGVVWILSQNQLSSEDVLQSQARTDSASLREKSASTAAGGKAGHVMISYNWGDQKVLLKVKDELRRRGFNIWMDVEQMGGSTLQAMAEAVENAAVVLICMSDRYKDSPNCRTEAEYSFKLNKDIVPLMMQRNYKPDGWLGMILGSKLFFDFSGKYNFECKVDELAKELGNRGKTGGIVPVMTETAALAPSFGSGKKNPSHWNKEDVAQWLEKNNLNRMPKFTKLTGEQIAFLKEIHTNAPEFFFCYMTDKMGIVQLQDLVMINNACKNL
ncbi:uncharacterized protein LOC106155047 [Lingula anatina]|uniref:Uncharacterized protein LOC106155047 n=1 Tax=Lingula anatina TaxID=7574 RepID=A0A1S3HGA3_LINAN|nr:uncharacterized protein LOC106155047 [Lingula anatina]XP_013385108.1 uncharacterized protein LOC106155047 [Lingula anatina]|eukprot:XP_013385107.1 uncharacterized protein LOC106155047 [Lingula anatina]